MKVKVSFTVDVEECDGDPLPPTEAVLAAVEEAFDNAIGYAEGDGHVHFLADCVSIITRSPVTAEVLE